MRSRNEIEKETESSQRNYDGSLQDCRADNEDMQALIIEVLLDIRDILSKGVVRES